MVCAVGNMPSLIRPANGKYDTSVNKILILHEDVHARPGEQEGITKFICKESKQGYR